ncbi:MAG: AI-2E family transporter [Thermoleophilia bacterium]
MADRLRARPGDGPSTASVVRVALTLVGLAALLWGVWISRTVVQWLAIAVFLAVAIDPLVGLVRRRTGLPRAGAIVAVYVLGAVATVVALLVFVPPLFDAANGLVSAIPQYIDQVQNSSLVQRLDRQYGVLDQVRVQLVNLLSSIAGPNVAVDAASRVVSGIIAVVSVLVLTFLFSLYGPAVRRWAEEQVDGPARERMCSLLDGAYKVVAGYVVGVAAVALIGSVVASTFMLIAGIPYIPLLGLWVAMMTFIPMVGATLGAIPYVTVGFFQSWQVGVAALVFWAVYQMIENHFVQPMIQRRAVRLNPLWIIIAVLVGTQILGLVGAMVSIPLAGIIQVATQVWFRARHEEWPAEGMAPPQDDEPDPGTPEPSAG